MKYERPEAETVDFKAMEANAAENIPEYDDNFSMFEAEEYVSTRETFR